MRKWFLLFFLPVLAHAAPVIFPSTATVFVKNSVTITSTDTVTCALIAGSTGTLSGCTYTAPSSFSAKNNFDGCSTRPNDEIYNTRIDSLPINANNTTRLSNLLGGTSAYIQFEFMGPHNVMNNSTPQTNMTFLFTSNYNGNFYTLPFPYMGVENGLLPTDYFAQDRHVLGVNTDTCKFYEMYNFYPAGSLPSGFGCPTCNSTSGVTYFGNSYQLGDTSGGSPGGTDAAGLYIQPLELHYTEVKAGHINHALRFTLANPYIYSGFAWPAQAFTNECSTFTKCYPYGSRWRLKGNFNISSYSPTTQVILTALKQYGMFMADGGTSMHLQMADDMFTDSVTYAAIQSEIRFGNIANQFNFEEIDESSLMVSTASGRVNLSNPYMVPDNFAEVKVTKTADSSTTSLRIALQPVTVGTKNIPFQANAGTLSIMAGTPQFQIPYWVNGATTTTATCSMSPSIGSLTSDCLYTAPSTQINFYSSTTVTITPTADATQAITEPLIVFPSDGIRVDVGGKSASNAPPYNSQGDYGPDANGNFWWNEPIGSAVSWNKIDGFFPSSSWGSSTDVGLWYTYRAGINDGAYAYMVPNGYYILTLGFGVDSGNGNITQFVQSLDSQGSTLATSTALSSVMGTVNYTPKSASYVVQVVDNTFYFALRMLTQGNFTLLNEWSLVPTTAPVFSTLGGGSRWRGVIR